MIELLIVACLAISSWLLCVLLSKPSSKFYVLDDPTHRSLHDEPKPRIGGIAIFAVIYISWIMIAFTFTVENFIYHLLAGMGLLAVISYLDDRYSISQIFRLVAHFIAATLLIIGGLELKVYELNLNEFIGSELVLDVLTVLAIVWIINLYNFMDGMDGLAAGMGLIGFSCLGWLGWFAGHKLFMLMAFIVAASNLGFLLHNFPPAKIFMGDVGSITMGYLVAFFSLWGINIGIFKWWIPILVFSPFIVDATITLFRRLFRSEKIWEAHKSHYYQKLVQNGWGHRKTVIFEYLLMMAAVCSAIVLTLENNSILTTYVLCSWFLLYVLIIFLVGRLRSNSGNFS